MRVLDAYGCDVILVETVGVGQDELEIARLAHTTVVVMAPGGGDDIQAIKAGILEIADVFAVNKADRDGADSTARDLEGMLALNETLVHAGAVHKGHSAAMMQIVKGAVKDGATTRWTAQVVKTVATRNEGLPELMAACEQHRAFLFGSDAGKLRMQQRREEELAIVFRDLLLARAAEKLGPELERARASLSEARADPYVVAEDLVIRVID